MKTLKLLICTALVLLLCGFKSDKITQNVLLVLEDTIQQESFSKFSVKESGGILVGENTDEYEVKSGIYVITGSSKQKFYHKRIIVI